jgi:hypothetical protein
MADKQGPEAKKQQVSLAEKTKKKNGLERV